MIKTVQRYSRALASFYHALADYKMAKRYEADDIQEALETLKNKAVLLQNEVEKLPPSMARPDLVKHIEEVLNFTGTSST